MTMLNRSLHLTSLRGVIDIFFQFQSIINRYESPKNQFFPHSQNSNMADINQGPMPRTQLTEGQRGWFIYYLGCVRTSLNKEVNHLSIGVYGEFCDLLQASDIHGMVPPPSYNTVRAVRNKFIETGSLKTASWRRRKHLPCREEVEFMAKTTQLSSRKISDQLENLFSENSAPHHQ